MATVSQAEPLLLNRRDAARMLSISERVLFDLTRDGVIPSVRLGVRGVRYSVRALEQRIEEMHGGKTP